MELLCKIKPELCIACGLCAIYAPTIFDYDEDGILLFKEEPVARQQFIRPEQQAALRKAAGKCPIRAILLEQLPAAKTTKDAGRL